MPMCQLMRKTDRSNVHINGWSYRSFIYDNDLNLFAKIQYIY